MEYRRSRTVTLYWHEGELTAENYLIPNLSDNYGENAVTVEPLAIKLLTELDDWADVTDIVRLFPGFTPESVEKTLADLFACGLLRTRDTASDEELCLTQWRDWGEEARFFHFATKDADYVAGDPVKEMEYRVERRAVGGPLPPIFKTYPDAPRVYLSRAHLPLRQDFETVLLARRTHRQFTGQSVDVRTFSTLLYYSFSPMFFCDADVFGTLMMKTSPSGGARHELEGYVAVFAVDGVEPGLYHYNAESHSLELLAGDFDRETVKHISYDVTMPPDSAFVCFVTAIFGRSMYKYPNSRNYRVTLLGAGHLGQTFALTATALGLGPWQTIVFRDTELEHALGVDGFTEGVIYMFGAGHPDRAISGLPKDLRLAGAGQPAELVHSVTPEA